MNKSSGHKLQTGNKSTGKSKHKPRSKFRRVCGSIGKGLLTVFLIMVITCCIVGGTSSIYLLNTVKPQNISLDKAELDSTTFMFATDTNGKQTTVAQISGEENRIWVGIDKMPDNLKNAFICTEDQRFNQHNGVDWKRTTSSFVNIFLPIYSSQQGGSTITQQLVNNLGKMGKKRGDYTRKLQEIVDALDVEKRYTKDQILEAYLNTINLNEGCYGVETAAENYFGKSVDKLDLAECAALACLPKAPSTYDPRKNPDKNSSRRVKTVLANMLKQNKITQEQYDAAAKEKLKIVPKKTVNMRGWFQDMVITDVQNDLVSQYGYTPEAALNMIYTKGLKIYTTENTGVQAAMDKVYSDSNNKNLWYTYEGVVQPQSSMMVVDYSGKIAGVVGGRGAKSGNMVLNRATQSKRQPGSSIKPIGVYAPALQLDKITWSTVFSKSQITVGGKPWPANDDYNYDGNLTVSNALAQSVNTVAVHIEQQELSPEYSFNFLTKKLGFTTLVSGRKTKYGIVSDKGLSLAIGALTDGVTVREMAGAYEIFGNGGTYYKPYSYTRVIDGTGHVILQNKGSGTQAISSDTAFIMNRLLQNNCLIGTGYNAQISGVQVGGKTGTTNDHKDRWFCGITPDYVGVVWFGYDQPKDISGYSSQWNPALKAWRNVMVSVTQKQSKTHYPNNGNVIAEQYDPATGFVTAKGTQTGWYKVTNIPTAPVDPAAS